MRQLIISIVGLTAIVAILTVYNDARNTVPTQDTAQKTTNSPRERKGDHRGNGRRDFVAPNSLHS